MKTLAKLANHLAKPSPRGVYLLTADDPVHDKVDVAEVWGCRPYIEPETACGRDQHGSRDFRTPTIRGCSKRFPSSDSGLFTNFVEFPACRLNKSANRKRAVRLAFLWRACRHPRHPRGPRELHRFQAQGTERR